MLLCPGRGRAAEQDWCGKGRLGVNPGTWQTWFSAALINVSETRPCFLAKNCQQKNLETISTPLDMRILWVPLRSRCLVQNRVTIQELLELNQAVRWPVSPLFQLRPPTLVFNIWLGECWLLFSYKNPREWFTLTNPHLKSLIPTGFKSRYSMMLNSKVCSQSRLRLPVCTILSFSALPHQALNSATVLSRWSGSLGPSGCSSGGAAVPTASCQLEHWWRWSDSSWTCRAGSVSLDDRTVRGWQV